MRIRAFTPLRPPADKAHLVASLPYDVVTTDEARELAAGNPLSMLHVVRAEIDLPPGTDVHSDAVYAKAVENFKRLQAEGALERETEPSVYIYQQRMGDHVQRGIVALCHADDYNAGLIKKHEKTRPDKENDRTRLTSDLSANAGPVFMTYRDSAEVTALVNFSVKSPPLYDFTAPDGIQHTAWMVPPEAMTRAFAAVPAFYVADGHHRSASAARVAAERASANPNHTGDEDYNWFLCVMFPGSELKILPYNRLVHDLNGRSAEEFLSELGFCCELTENAPETPTKPGQVSMYIGGHWYGLTLEPPPDADPVARLDVEMLQQQVLSPLLGIDDPRTSERVTFAGGIRGTSYLKAQVDSAHAAVAFNLHPVTIQQLLEIADAGQIMPPKSTWFEPKLRSGLFIHTF